MNKVQDTRGYERYMAMDIHREYILVGAWNEEKEWILMPRRVSLEGFPEWAKKNIRTGDIVVLETTTNVWATYDIVAPLAGRVLVANAAEVEEIAKARVKTDKEDVKKLLKLLVGGIVPEVWVPPMEVRELRAFISYRGRLVTPALAGGARETSAMIRNRLQSLLHKHNLKLSETGLLDQVWWEAQKDISSLEKMQIRQELVLLQEVEKLKTAVDEELQRQSTGSTWGKPALQLMQLPGVGYIVAMTVLSAIGDTPAPTAGNMILSDTRTNENEGIVWLAAGCEVDAHWCPEPEPQADPATRRHPTLSPPAKGEHATQNLF